jgi:helix-turn-helix protein
VTIVSIDILPIKRIKFTGRSKSEKGMIFSSTLVLEILKVERISKDIHHYAIHMQSMSVLLMGFAVEIVKPRPVGGEIHSGQEFLNGMVIWSLQLIEIIMEKKEMAVW